MKHWYKIDLELKQLDGTWKVYHSFDLEWDDFNDDFKRTIDRMLEGLYGIDRMVIYYDTERNLKKMEEIKKK